MDDSKHCYNCGNTLPLTQSREGNPFPIIIGVLIIFAGLFSTLMRGFGEIMGSWGEGFGRFMSNWGSSFGAAIADWGRGVASFFINFTTCIQSVASLALILGLMLIAYSLTQR